MKGSLFGDYRVIKPVGALPQPAEILNNDMSILYDNEIRVNVETLNVDSASFTQIKNQANGDLKKIEEIITKADLLVGSGLWQKIKRYIRKK